MTAFSFKLKKPTYNFFFFTDRNVKVKKKQLLYKVNEHVISSEYFGYNCNNRDQECYEKCVFQH